MIRSIPEPKIHTQVVVPTYILSLLLQIANIDITIYVVKWEIVLRLPVIKILLWLYFFVLLFYCATDSFDIFNLYVLNY